MAAVTEQNQTADPEQAEPVKEARPRRPNVRELLRKLMMAAPLLLLLAAIAASLGFYVTTRPELVYAAVGLVVAAILWWIMLAFMAPKS